MDLNVTCPVHSVKQLIYAINLVDLESGLLIETSQKKVFFFYYSLKMSFKVTNYNHEHFGSRNPTCMNCIINVYKLVM